MDAPTRGSEFSGLHNFRFTKHAERGKMLGLAWGVVQSVGHLTVNEDGGGSSPPAPAKLFRFVLGFSMGKPASVQPRQPPSMEITLV